MGEKNGFDITKLIFQNVCVCVWHCGAVVKEVLVAPSDDAGLTLGDAIFCFFVLFSFFFLFSLCFLVLFSFWPVFLYSCC